MKRVAVVSLATLVIAVACQTAPVRQGTPSSGPTAAESDEAAKDAGVKAEEPASPLAGVGQRMVKGAAHLGFVILVSGSGLVAETLAPVYSALELEYDPQKVGSLEDVVPGVGLEEVEDALLERLDLYMHRGGG